MRTITAAISGFIETQNKWKVCKERAIRLTKNAISLLPCDSDGLIFMKALFTRAEGIVDPPSREVQLQKYASVFGDTIVDIEYEAVLRSGISIDELNRLASSLPGHPWLFNP